MRIYYFSVKIDQNIETFGHIEISCHAFLVEVCQKWLIHVLEFY